MQLATGDPVRLESATWVDRPHYAYDAVFLGADGHGDWIGIPAGTTIGRPGNHWVSSSAFVQLAPAAGPDGDRGYLASFYRGHATTTIYVDMTTPPRWDRGVLRAVDLDLDVVRTHDGDVWIDDEDEFAEHQLRYAYPAEVVALARATADRIVDDVLHERAPYDGTAQGWFGVLDELVESRGPR